MDEVAVASRALDLLIFLACSLTLDLASTIDALALAAVERARTNCVGETALEAAGTRILEAERDMLATATTTRATTAKSKGAVRGKVGQSQTGLESTQVYKLDVRVIPTEILAPHRVT